MDYIDTPAGAVSYQGRGAAWLLSYAATLSPPRKVRLGLAVRQPGAPRTWWQADNITALDTLLNEIVPLATPYTSWSGFAVFHTALWRASVRLCSNSLNTLGSVRKGHTLTKCIRSRTGGGKSPINHWQPRSSSQQRRLSWLVCACGRDLQRNIGTEGFPQVGHGRKHYHVVRPGFCWWCTQHRSGAQHYRCVLLLRARCTCSRHRSTFVQRFVVTTTRSSLHSCLPDGQRVGSNKIQWHILTEQHPLAL
jgi:hypothetical protein